MMQSTEGPVFPGAPGGIRNPNLLIRSQVLYPLSYGRVSRAESTGVHAIPAHPVYASAA